MKLSTILPVTAAVLTAQASVVHWEIEKRFDTPSLRRRDDSVQASLANNLENGGYFASVKVGTPGQTFSLQVDTGSSDVWVPAKSAKACQGSPGCALGSFDPSLSTTLVKEGVNFSIQYQDKDSATGEYIQDTFEIGGITIQNLTLAVATDTTSLFGLAGVAYPRNEASFTSSGILYSNLPVALASHGFIKTVAYSLWLNDLAANTGDILFGGIDTEKYIGNLTKINILPGADGKIVNFIVSLTTVEFVGSSGGQATSIAANQNIPVILDSGTTFSYLPQVFVQQIWDQVGAEITNEAQGLAAIPCSFANSKDQLSFVFGGNGGPRINVDMSELAIKFAVNAPGPVFQSGKYKGQEQCRFGFQVAASGPYLLGDTLLRSAYVVYDLSNNQVALAATNLNSTKSNVIAFPSKGAPIPSATAAPNQNSTNGTFASTPTQPNQTAEGNAAISVPTFAGSGLATVILSLAFICAGALL